MGEAYSPYPHPGDDPPASAAALSVWQWQMARCAQHQGAINIYTHALLSSLDPTPLARISAQEDGTGTANLTLLEIMTRLENLYGYLPAAALTVELNKLERPFAHGMSIDEHLTMYAPVVCRELLEKASP